MRTFEDLEKEQLQSVLQAVADAEAELDRARRKVADNLDERRSLETAVQGLRKRHRDFDPPQAAERAQIGALEAQLLDIQRILEARKKQLAGLQQQAEAMAAEIRKRNAQIATTDRMIQESETQLRAREGNAQQASARVRETRLRAWQAYSEEVIRAFKHTATELSALQRFQKLKAEFEAALQTDQELRAAHEERLELRQHLAAAHVPAVKALLSERVLSVDSIINRKFKGVLEPPPADDAEELLESFYWYDREDDATFVLLPLPISCWNTPPQGAADPRGEPMCRILWTMSTAVENSVPAVDRLEDLVVLEWHGDQAARVAEAIGEMSFESGRSLNLLCSPLPQRILEALQ